jgi:hypothetical protein
MSEYYGAAGDLQIARKELVDLEYPYSRLVQEAITAAIQRTLDAIFSTLIFSAFSPVPKDTGRLRQSLKVDVRPVARTGGISLVLTWGEGVPYAEHLLAKAGLVNVRHTESTLSSRGGLRYDPMAENPWMEPSMRLVFPLVLSAVQQELQARGIQFTQSW